jgi:hypothetical protein
MRRVDDRRRVLCGLAQVEETAHNGRSDSRTLQRSMAVTLSAFLALPLATEKREVQLRSQCMSVMPCQLRYGWFAVWRQPTLQSCPPLSAPALPLDADPSSVHPAG